MKTDCPLEVRRLLDAASPAERDRAWDALVSQHSRLLLHTARSLGGDHDAVMDRYAYVLEQLRAQDYRRLRGYVADERCRFTTWLVVVARRLCLDQHRARYGRPRDNPGTGEATRTRRTLVDHLEGHLDVALLAASAPSPEHEAVTRDVHVRLARALAELEPRDRLLLALRFEDERPAREIAHIMGFPTPFHVYRRVNRLLETLRARLAAAGIDSAEP